MWKQLLESRWQQRFKTSMMSRNRNFLHDHGFLARPSARVFRVNKSALTLTFLVSIALSRF